MHIAMHIAMHHDRMHDVLRQRLLAPAMTSARQLLTQKPRNLVAGIAVEGIMRACMHTTEANAS
jgi:hypothetical protein